MSTNPVVTKPITTPITTPITIPPIKLPVGTAPQQLTPTNPTISGADATVAVTVPNTSGTVTFQLVVTDQLGTESAPVTVTVEIQSIPTAVLSATPNPAGAGATITLSGANSSAAGGGSIKNYAFTLQPSTVVTDPNTPKP